MNYNGSEKEEKVAAGQLTLEQFTDIVLAQVRRNLHYTSVLSVHIHLITDWTCD